MKKAYSGFIAFAIFVKNGSPYSLWGYSTESHLQYFYPFDKMSTDAEKLILSNMDIPHFDVDMGTKCMHAIVMQNGSCIVLFSDGACLVVTSQDLELLSSRVFITTVPFKAVFYQYSKASAHEKLSSHELAIRLSEELQLLSFPSRTFGASIVSGSNLGVSVSNASMPNLVIPYGIREVYASKMDVQPLSLVVPETVTCVSFFNKLTKFRVSPILIPTQMLYLKDMFADNAQLYLGDCINVALEGTYSNINIVEVPRGRIFRDSFSLSVHSQQQDKLGISVANANLGTNTERRSKNLWDSIADYKFMINV